MLIPRRFAALCGIGKGDRYTPNGRGLRVEPLANGASGQAVAVTTDGFRMIGVTFTPIADDEFPRVPGLPDGALTVPADGVVLDEARFARVAGAHKAGATLPVLDQVAVGMHEGRAACASTDLAMPVVQLDAAQDGNFPRWREVVPTIAADESRTVQLDAALLVDTLTRMMKLREPGKRKVYVRLTVQVHTRPVMMELAADDHEAQVWALQMTCDDAPANGKPVGVRR